MYRTTLSLALSSLLFAAGQAEAALLPGLGEVSGAVAAPKGVIIPVHLENAEKNIGYTVFAVNGRYRAIDILPGHYEVTIRKDGFDLAPLPVDVARDSHSVVDLAPKTVPHVPTYVLGMTHKDNPTPEPYDKIYPKGPGLDVAKRTCMVCHGVNFLPNKQLDREGWASLIDRMIAQPAFEANGIIEGPSMMDPARLPPKDKEILLNYLTANFGADAPPRAVLQEREPQMDPVALSKAMFIEYRIASDKKRPHRFTQETHFDEDGNVLMSERGRPAGIVKLDPRTGENKTYDLPDIKNSPHGLTVDKDATVWWTGANEFVGHLDPATGKTDLYPVPELGFHGNTPMFTSNGDIFISELIGNKLAHWSRATNKVTYYEAPGGGRSRPYGLIVDHHDKVWYSEYHEEHVTRFDPVTEQFTRFAIKSVPASLRRLGVDSKDIIWYGVYGSAETNGKLGRLDPKTGAVTEREIPVDYANPYDVQVDDRDDVWQSMDNYLVKFDQKSQKFTVYPIPFRTDEPKISVTRESAIWFAPRGAGTTTNYGGGAAVLYPDKDKITTLGAYYSPNNPADRVMMYKGPNTPVTGAVYETPDGAKNPGAAKIASRGKPPSQATGGEGRGSVGMAD